MNSILLRRINSKSFHTSSSVLFPKRWKEKSEVPFQSELTNPVAEVYGASESWPENEFGYLFDKKPFKVAVKKYHLYTWCGCGRGHAQPFCGGTYRNPEIQELRLDAKHDIWDPTSKIEAHKKSVPESESDELEFEESIE